MYRKADRSNPRGYTCALLEMVDEGMVDRDMLIRDLLMYMSEHEVKMFCDDAFRDEDNQPLIKG